jgi:hypothetical protein
MLCYVIFAVTAEAPSRHIVVLKPSDRILKQLSLYPVSYWAVKLRNMWNQNIHLSFRVNYVTDQCRALNLATCPLGCLGES